MGPFAAGIVVASGQCLGDPNWSGVVHEAARVRGWSIVEAGPDTIAAALGGARHEYAIVVAMPGEAGRAACAQWQRAFRALDADPHEDCAWGVVTGPTADVAMRIARRTEPVVLEAALGTTALPEAVFPRGMWFSEARCGEVHQRDPERGWVIEQRGDEQSRAFTDAFAADWADFILTSGRSNEMRWLLGYSYASGRVVPRRGELWVRDLNGVEAPIRSVRSKAMLAAGNCLMAHLRDGDSLAMALLDGGGVDQLAGYTSTTWDGRAGWGCAHWLFDEPGRWSLAEAVHWTRAELIARMERSHPEDLARVLDGFDRSARADFEQALLRAITPGGVDPSREPDARAPSQGAECEAPSGGSDWASRLGALWDRDAFILVGDPSRRMAPAQGARCWEGGIEWRLGVPWCVVRALSAQAPTVPPVVRVPPELAGRLWARNAGAWCVCDSFAMLLEPGEWRAGQTWEEPLWAVAGYASDPTKGPR